MTRKYVSKLILFLACFLVPTVLVTGQQWISISTQTPSHSNFICTGSTGSIAEISVEIPGFNLFESFVDGKIVYSPQIPDGHPLLMQGSPDLQKLSFTLQLPANGNMEVSVLSSKYKEYYDIDILPSAGNVIRNESISPLSKGEAFSIDAFFPGELIGFQQPFIVRNTRSQAFQVYPFQYNPVTRVLRFYYQVNFKMIHTGCLGDNPLSETDARINSIDGIEAGVINKQSSVYKSGQLPSERGRMLIICPENYKSALTPLIKWRKQTGIETEIIKAEQFSGPDAIYTYLKKYYYEHGDLAYLLLVGDAKQVPPFMLPYGASDNSYSYLAGNDHYPDILVGRFSAESPEDVEVQVNRILLYEKEPGKDAAWITSVTGIGSTLSPGDDGESDFEHIRNLMKKLKSATYTVTNEMFDGSQGEGDQDGDPVTINIIEKINQGNGIIFYAGHGSPTSWGTGKVTESVVENLNNIGKYPLIWSAACENGNFVDKYCLAEAWTRARNSNGQPTGALAAVMASGAQTSCPPMEAQDEITEMLADPQERISTMGAVTIKGMMAMNDVYETAGYATTDTWILFGDPSLRIRTMLPKQLIVDHKGTIGRGRSSYTLTSNSADGFACISQDGLILGTSIITDGIANFSLNEPVSDEDLTLTVTALNYIPYVAAIEVINLPGNPESCFPLNHSKLQSINSYFSWGCSEGGNPDYYLFYLGTDNPPTNLINGQNISATQFKPRFNFEYDKKYYWKVVTVNSFGRVETRVMDFTTVFEPDEDFEPVFKSRLNWGDGGTKKWENDGTEFFAGKNSIRSGQINKNEFSSLIYPCNVSICDFVSFWSKTSSNQQDKLQFIVDGILVEEWGGLTEWSFHSYKIESGNHQLEWRFTKNTDASAGFNAAWLDNIHLPIHEPVTASVSDYGSVCEGSAFNATASASNYFSLTWQTDGDGYFEDQNIENVVYHPGLLDIKKKMTFLEIYLNGFNGCPAIEKIIEIDINSLPFIDLPSDTIVSSGSSVELDAGSCGDMTYNWQPGGSSNASVIIDSVNSVNGTKTANITVTSPQGCSASKEIQIHFNNAAVEDSYNIYPNPNNGNFTLEPLKGSAVIDQAKLVDGTGKVMWASKESFIIVGSKQLSIESLTRGIYFLITENNNGRSVNKLMIK